MSTGFIKKLDPPHTFPFVTNPIAVLGRPIPFSTLPAPEDLSSPISNSISHLLQYNPKSIDNGSTLLLWIDLGDKTSFDISNNIVTAIRDKGKDSKPITILGTFTTSSQNNLPVLKDAVVPGGNNWSLKIFNFNMRKTFTTFLVCKSPNTTWRQTLMMTSEIGQHFSATMESNIYQGSEITIRDKNSPFRRTESNGTTVVPYNTYIIYVIGHSISNTVLSTYRINGTSYESTPPVIWGYEPTTYYNGTFWLYPFWLYTGDPYNPFITPGLLYSIMETAEYIIYDKDLSFSEVEKIEGYLAAKWGLQSSLPETHAFRRVPPANI